jgi:hypothetical protein
MAQLFWVMFAFVGIQFIASTPHFGLGELTASVAIAGGFTLILGYVFDRG